LIPGAAASADGVGVSVSTAGDIDGDGLDDLIVGASNADPNGNSSGATYVVLGKTDTDVVNLADVQNGTGGFVINGASDSDLSGFTVSTAGDVDGDGLDDLIIGAPMPFRGPLVGNTVGAAYVVFGTTDTSAIQLTAVQSGSNGQGFVMNGPAANAFVSIVGSAGDVNGDGLDDLIVGSGGANGGAGATYVIYGKADGGIVELSAIDNGDPGGFVLNGISAVDSAERSVHGAGDINGDGFADLIIGARYDDPTMTDSGASFVVFGGDFNNITTDIGTAGDDNLSAGAGTDRIVAGTGNDSITGVGTGDVVRGGAGDDEIRITSTDFGDIDGGTGTDTIVLDGSGLTLDLDDIGASTLTGIEGVDLGSGSAPGNTLNIDGDDLVNMSDTDNTLVVSGGSNDTVNLEDGGWTDTGTQQNIGGTLYNVYENGNGTILIEVGVVVTGLPVAVIELSDIEDPLIGAGFVINGNTADDLAGYSVSAAGDVNGDGYEDVIVCASDLLGPGTAHSYVIFGKTDGSALELSNVADPLNTPLITEGFVINGDGANDQFEYSVSGAGDVNGDGLSDLLIGARGSDRSFVVFGKADDSAINITALTAAGSGDGFVLNGVALSQLGRAVDIAGDVNGDGLDDLIVGAPAASSRAGESFVVFGKTDDTPINMTAVAQNTNDSGFSILGFANPEEAGRAVSGIGDFDGDGLDDLFVGSPFANGYDGAGYIVFGKDDGTQIDLNDLDTASSNDGFALFGDATDQSRAGLDVAGGGDVNGDGFADVIISAPLADPGGVTDSGEIYVVFGENRAAGPLPGLNLNTLETAGNGDGFVIAGFDTSDIAGFSVDVAGDVNGDGLDDLIIGAYRADPNGNGDAGKTYVVYGRTDDSPVQASDLALGTGGFVINGVSSMDYAGADVSSAGDVNGDGFADLLVGAPRDDQNGTAPGDDTGAAFVIFGGTFNQLATIVGDATNETLTGGTGDDRIVAGDGDDRIEGNGGADVMRGGAGDDTFILADTNFADIDGGTGNDTLEINATGQTLDLAAIDNESLSSIEAVNLTDNGNTLSIDPQELLRMSDDNQAGVGTVLTVNGGPSDTVDLVGGGWFRGGTFTDAGGTVYEVYDDGNAVIRIEQGITVTGGQVDVIELSEVEQDSSNLGFVINGYNANGYAGTSVSKAGDLDGDGFEDLFISSFDAVAGRGHLVFGQTAGTAIELADINDPLPGNRPGFDLIDNVGNGVGSAVSAAGDINGDGIQDLIVGAGNLGGVGGTYVVFGKSDKAPVVLSDLDAGTDPRGFLIEGNASSLVSGYNVSHAGDVNGDGLDDLIIGDPYETANGVTNSGRQYVVFGKTDTASIELSDIAQVGNGGGFVINGASLNERAGFDVSNAGDVNGDGLDDLIIGARLNDTNAANAAAYVVFGKQDSDEIDLSTLALSTNDDGFVINGFYAGQDAGYSVSSLGDINGDGLADLAVGSDGGVAGAGTAYVIFGKADGVHVEISDIDDAGDPDGFVINATGSATIGTVAGAGDVNGDGIDDILVGTRGANTNGANSGAAYVIYGRPGGAIVELSDVGQGGIGFVVNGSSAGDNAGAAVSAAGDVNGDGFEDIFIGARYDDPNATDAGAGFVVFGGNFNLAASVIGTPAGEAINDGAGIDRLIAGAGDDTILSSGGTDVIRGGEGDDLIIFTGAGFLDIDGGTGTDTIRFFANQNVDFRNISNEALTGVEQIRFFGNTSYILDKNEVLDISDETNTLRFFATTASNTITLTDTGWSLTGQITDGGLTFDVYENGNARLEVDVTGLTPTVNLPGSPIQLSDVEMDFHQRGFVINGFYADARSGTSVSSAGDVNGDGFDDLIVGAPQTDIAVSDEGSAAYIVFGRGGGTSFELSDIDNNPPGQRGGFQIIGSNNNDGVGISVSAAGDLNGDGFDDLLVGNDGSGRTFVVYGGTDEANVTTSTLLNNNNPDGYTFLHTPGSPNFGDAVSGGGDINGDGIGDILIGSRTDAASGTANGSVFVAFGKSDNADATVNTSDIIPNTGGLGFVINGANISDLAGFSVSMLGDVNGDGLDDILVGAIGDDPNATTNGGTAYVVFGKTDDDAVDLAALDTAGSSAGFVINGFSNNDLLGFSVGDAGDVDGDGLADLIIGIRDDDPGVTSNAGAALVVFGKASDAPVELSLVSQPGNNDGFIINGINDNDEAGFSVDGAGDFNGDGLDDLLVGVRFLDTVVGVTPVTNAGGAFVIYGKADGNVVEMSDVQNGTGGVALIGIDNGDYTGWSVSAAGDVDGDGLDDIIIGSESDDPNATDSGASFVVFGADFNGVTTDIGTTGADSLVGTGSADRIIAGTGNDTIDDVATGDVVRGGAGDDLIIIDSLAIDFADIDAGGGTDTVRLDASNLTLDLTAVDNESFDSVEVIDLNNGTNTLIVDPLEVQRASEDGNTLRVNGGASDTVDLQVVGWTAAGTVLDGGVTYDVYTNGNATIEIEQAVGTVNLPAVPNLTVVELCQMLRAQRQQAAAL
jgi:hypothetical protein